MITAPERRMLVRRHLDAWMIAATKGLADESYERVREEIVDHFHEALDAGVASGLPPEAAARQAIDALGSARRARRQFRRTYLTTSQAKTVGSFSGVARSPREGSHRARLWLALLLIATTAAFNVYDAQAGGPSLVGLLCLTAMIAGLGGLGTTPRIFRSGRERAAVAIGALSEFAIWSGYLVSGSHDRPWVAAFVLALAAIMALGVLPVLPKLPRNAGSE